ncbi:MAG: hypothetical protein AAFN06_10415 [Pseudomonadota bacterium]
MSVTDTSVAPRLATDQPGAMAMLAVLFVVSMTIPVFVHLGPLLLMPHRLLLLLAFFPCFVRVFVMRSCGGAHAFDWLMLFAGFWAVVALMVNHGPLRVIEPAGILVLETFGAYLLARATLRSSADFRLFAKTLFFVLIFFLPFAVLESLTLRPVFLDVFPFNSVRPADAGVRMGMRRAQTAFAHPILYGAFAVMSFGIVFFCLRGMLRRLVGGVAAILSTFFALSSGPLIGLITQFGLVVWHYAAQRIPRRWTIFGWLALAGYVSIDLLSNRTPFHVLVTYASFNTGSAYNRIRIWDYGMENVAENPIFGLGMREWIRPSWMVVSIDNFWLFLSMHYGLPMIISVLIAMVLIVRRISWAKLPDKDDLLCRTGFLISFGGMFLAGATVHYWHAIQAMSFFIIGSGIWMVTGGAKQLLDEPGNVEAANTTSRSRYSRFPVKLAPSSGGHPAPGASSARSVPSGSGRAFNARSPHSR